MELAVALAGIVLLYFLQVFAYRLYWDKGLHMQLHFQRVAAREGESVKLYETITNRKRLALPVFSVLLDICRNGRACLKEPEGEGEMRGIGATGKKLWFLHEVFSLQGREEKEHTIEIKGLKRGYHQISEIKVNTSNLFLTEIFPLKVATGSSLYVYPKALSEDETEPLLRFLSQVNLTDRYSYEDDLELRGIREYQTFDPMKRVNWKASARTGELQVNLMEYVANRQIMLLMVFDGMTEEEEREYAISLTAGLAEYCLEQGVPVGVISNGEDYETETCLWIPACAGKAGRESILQGLSRLWIPRSPVEMKSLLAPKLSENVGMDGCTYIVLDACREPHQVGDLIEQLQYSGEQYHIYRVADHRQEVKRRRNRVSGVEW